MGATVAHGTLYTVYEPDEGHDLPFDLGRASRTAATTALNVGLRRHRELAVELNGVGFADPELLATLV